MKLKSFDFASNSYGESDLAELMLPSDHEVNVSVIRKVIVWQANKDRLWTRKGKTISEVSGTTAKPHRQKGTGSARQGSKRSNQFVGGGNVFGPAIKNEYSFKMNKKAVTVALSNALLLKISEGSVLVATAFEGLVKTAQLAKAIKASGAKKSLLVCDDESIAQIGRIAKNIALCKLIPVSALNCYDLINSDKIFFFGSASKKLEDLYGERN